MQNLTGSPNIPVWWLYCLAWCVALLATLSAVFIGEVLGQMPCTLCWYQRIAMFPLVLILGIGCYRSDPGAILYALPLSLIGFGLALYHSLLYAGVVDAGIVPCGSGSSCSGANMTLFNVLPIPYLAVLSFAVIISLLLIVLRKNR